MAAPDALTGLLNSLTQSLSLTQEATPKLVAFDYPDDGISLLDVKNELLLSYLQNLVFLILLKLRNARSSRTESREIDGELTNSVRDKLIELRLFLEKGAKPLEDKLRFSIERFLRIASDFEREKTAPKKPQRGSDASRQASDVLSDDEESRSEDKSLPHRPARSAAPNLLALRADPAFQRVQKEEGDGAGLYRAPKRERVVMEPSRPRGNADRRPNNSNTMEEYVLSELSSAPVAEPSIGTTIVQRGRRMSTAQDLKEEAERREYEETNLVRLPKLSKKERAKKNMAVGRRGRMEFGGEEWRDLGEGVDRIDRLTRQKGASGNNVRALLEKSRKRGFDVTDGPRGSGHGAEMGERFRKKVRMLEAGRRDRGKRR